MIKRLFSPSCYNWEALQVGVPKYFIAKSQRFLSGKDGRSFRIYNR